MNKSLYFIILLSLGIKLTGQNLPDTTAKDFIDALIMNRVKLDSFIEPEEIVLSNRLGIKYNGITNKYLISNDIDSSLRSRITAGKAHYEYKTIDLGKGFSKIVLSIPSENIEREYYFNKSLLVSAPYYYSSNWEIVNSDYFVFHLSDKTLLNEYSIKRLNKFVENTAALLEYDKNELEKLKKNKIHYFLCKNEDEIKNLTGYNTRGLYYLPFDYIITTYNCHLHELLHLLMNYKLKELDLFTHPFLQEGFAVAFGGRGGQDSDILLNMGLYLESSDFLNYKSLLNRQDFISNDASLTYPVSALYNKFLLERIGIKEYLKLYRNYTVKEDEISSLVINKSNLPSDQLWIKYLSDYPSNHITIDAEYSNLKINESLPVYYDKDYYIFKIKKYMLISTTENYSTYKSKKFAKLFPDKIYNSEKYLVSVDSNEVTVYNLFNNDIIAKYVRAFSSAMLPVKKDNYFFVFKIKKDVFEESFDKWKIQTD